LTRIVILALGVAALVGCDQLENLPMPELKLPSGTSADGAGSGSGSAAEQGPALAIGGRPAASGGGLSILPGRISDPLAEAPPAITASQCGQLQTGGPTNGCLTGTISCGETVIGHTRGGSKSFDTRYYESKQCAPATRNRDGGDERVYLLTMPEGDHTAWVHLDSPCADLDLAAMKWSGPGCPRVDHNVYQCEMNPVEGPGHERVKLASQAATKWLIVVEGKNEDEGAFGLTVLCREGL
jgi:hypothetical protein